MAYTATWDETQPLGTAAANTIDDVIRALKRDTRERMNDALGTANFATDDPVRIGVLRFTDRVIGPATGIAVRNNADSIDNLTISDAGAVAIRSTLAAVSSFYISAAAATTRQIVLQTAGVARWVIRANADAEVGANAGSNFRLDTYSDGGVYINTPISIARSTGVVTVNTTLIGAVGITVSAAAGGARDFAWHSSGVVRWIARANSTAESGANAGSDFELNRYSDAGALIGAALSIVRSTAAATFAGALTVSGGIAGTITTAAQPNITSLGTLTSLIVSGLTTLQNALNLTGTLEIGNQSAAAQANIEFHAEGTTTDNARISREINTNGLLKIANIGTGSIVINTNGSDRWFWDSAGHLRVSADNSYDIGTTAARIRGIYAQTNINVGTTNTTRALNTTTFQVRNTAGAALIEMYDTTNTRASYITMETAGFTINGGTNTVIRTLADTFSILNNAAAVTIATFTTANLQLNADLYIAAAAARIRGGATSLAIRNNADSRDNLLVVDAGDATVFRNLIVGGQGYSSRNDAGVSGAAKTIDWNDGNVQALSLTGNVTLTLDNPVAGACYVLELTQDATGGRTVTWPAAVKWSSGSAPTITTTANRTTIISLYYNGTSYAGAMFSNDYSL